MTLRSQHSTHRVTALLDTGPEVTLIHGDLHHHPKMKAVTGNTVGKGLLGGEAEELSPKVFLTLQPGGNELLTSWGGLPECPATYHRPRSLSREGFPYPAGENIPPTSTQLAKTPRAWGCPAGTFAFQEPGLACKAGPPRAARRQAGSTLSSPWLQGSICSGTSGTGSPSFLKDLGARPVVSLTFSDSSLPGDAQHLLPFLAYVIREALPALLISSALASSRTALEPAVIGSVYGSGMGAASGSFSQKPSLQPVRYHSLR